MTDSVRPARKKAPKKETEAAFSFDDIAPQTGRKKASKAAAAGATTKASRTKAAATPKAKTAPQAARTGPSKSDIIGVGVLALVIAAAVALHWAVSTFHPLERRPHAMAPAPISWAAVSRPAPKLPILSLPAPSLPALRLSA